MALTILARNAMLDGIGITLVSLHTGDPGENGANEVTGGTYAQQSITFSAAASGNLDSSNTPVFDVPSGTTVTHVGYWAGATFKGGDAVTNEVFASDGTYTLTDADISLT